MAAIRGRDTKPELVLRRGLHALGLRYRLHGRKLPGRPDIVLARYRAALFVHGCFWHGHECDLFRWPRTRTEFWRDKISGNVLRDAAAITALREAGWRTGVVWECALRGRNRLDRDDAIAAVASWIRSGDSDFELSGRSAGEGKGN